MPGCNAVNLLIFHLVRKPIGAEDDDVTVLDPLSKNIYLHIGTGAQSTGDDTAVNVFASLFFGDHASLHLVRHPGVVPSDLVNPTLMDVIGATIPYVGYKEPVAL